MTQEFAKTQFSDSLERFAPVLSPEKTKKACILLHFCIIILFKGKAISYHLSI